VTIRPTPEDIDLLVQLIDMRDSAHLAGHTQDAFHLTRFQGTGSILISPGRSGHIQVSTFGMERLRDLNLFRVTSASERGLNFDLVDDIRDRLEEMRVAAGKPSRMGELEAAAGRAEVAREAAEAAQRDQETNVAAAARSRADLRAVFALRVGQRVRRAMAVVLGLLYVSVVVVAGYLVSSNLPMALVVGIIVVAVALGVLEWLLHIDGFLVATWAERWVVRRIEDWLASFDRT
jgi:hypothetical protein